MIDKVIRPLLEPDMVKKLEKHSQRFHVDLQQVILNDIGRGSIFENITKLNNQMTERLKIKIDMRERFMQRMEDMGKFLVHEAAVDVAMGTQPDKKKLNE